MSTMGPFRIGKQVGDGYAVVTDNPVAGYEGHTDDRERYGGTPVARGCTIENAALFAVAPELLQIAEDVCEIGGHDKLRARCRAALERIFTRMPQ